MITDRRGDIGFLEAMTSAMAVCIVLTAFIAFMSCELAEEREERAGFDWSLMNGTEIVGGQYVWDPGSVLEVQANNRGLSGIIIAAVPGAEGVEPREWTYGDTGGDRTVERHAVPVPSDDGRTVPTVFEVYLCVRTGRG